MESVRFNGSILRRVGEYEHFQIDIINKIKSPENNT